MESAGRRIQANCKKPTPRSGHVAVTYGGLMLVWGGYTEQLNFSDANETGHQMWYVGDDIYLDGKEVWCYNIEAKVWDVWHTRKSPPGMSGSCAACIGKHMYLFGGYYKNGNSNELYRLDLKTKVWKHLKPEGMPPSPRDKVTCWSYQDKLVIFGGFGPPPYNEDDTNRTDEWQLDPSSFWSHERGWNNQLIVYSTTDNRWSYVKSERHRPCPRAAHAVAVIGNRGYVFGGRFEDVRMNDLHVLNLDSMEWVGSIQPASEDIPTGRSWHCMAPVSDRHLLVYGGYSSGRPTDCKPLNDVWVFDVENHTWHQQKSLPSETRMWHTGVSGADLGEAVVYGGCSNDLLDQDQRSVHSSKCFHFFFSPKSLSRLCAEAIVSDIDVLGSELSFLPTMLHRKIELCLNGRQKDESKNHSYNLRSRSQSS
ncbi:kelch domain-containing protein 2-like [Patiria miniata]|uniref:Kelch domain-containing protein 2 n=1 Tax=Patiria miniata TaxID=46514 RepID=A0A914B814_PATMI|nr:kelch domain-containing protein 2-like [Patiria miniata]